MTSNGEQKEEGVESRLRKEDSSYHHGDLRSALVRAGLLILREQGAHRLSLREAARIVGVSQAAPYRHFANKEALLAAIAQEGFAALGKEIRAAFQTTDGASGGFHQAALAYLDHALDQPDHFRLMFASTSPIQPQKHPELDRRTHELFQEFVSIIERCQKEKIVRSGDPEQIALVAWSAFHGLVSLAINNGLAFMSVPAPKIQDAMRSLVGSLLEGLKPA